MKNRRLLFSSLKTGVRPLHVSPFLIHGSRYVITIFLLISFFLINSNTLHAQGLSGIWKGTLTQNAGGCFPVYFIEIQVNFSGDSVIGSTYHYSNNSNYVKKKFKGSYNKVSKKLNISEGLISVFKIPPDCTPCIKKYELYYSKTGNKEILSGQWKGKIVNTDRDCQPGQLVLTKVTESAFAEIPEYAVDTGNIKLSFYDNGIIDGDIISVFANNKTIAANQKLSATALTLTIRIDDKTTFQEVEMVAQNEGDIPPNTAILIVNAGSVMHRIFLSSSLQKSAKIRFIYEPGLIPKKTI